MSIVAYNPTNNLFMFFPNLCGSSWAEQNLADYLVDEKETREIYHSGVDPILITRCPMDFFVSGYRWSLQDPDCKKMPTFRQFCQAALNDYENYLETGQISYFAHHSWAGPNIQINFKLDQKRVVLNRYIDLKDSDTLYDYTDRLAGKKTSRTPQNQSKNLGNTHYVPPDLINKSGIRSRVEKMFAVNEYWAGYQGYDVPID
jgi:hypothetical protein